MASFRTIGRFEIEGERATGGAGTVYAGRDPASGIRVAVKLIRGLTAADMARFRREAETLAQLRHPGVVRYVDHGQIGSGTAYLAMELLDGEDLKARLAREPLTFHETAVLGQRVADALAAVHGHRLVHRDIKPANIFLPEGRIADATLVDFGLVRHDQRGLETDVTATGIVVGTPAYMSPEQARGQRGIDARADIFALGCVLYRCIAGRAPFEGKHIVAVLTKVILEHPPPLRGARPDVPGPLADLVGRMLEKAPDRRPASATVVARALGALVPVLEAAPSEGGDDEPPPSSRSGLTTSELWIATLLMVGGAPHEESGDVHEKVRAIAAAEGCRIEGLREGTQVITVTAVAPVSDQATRVAEIALALRSALPAARMAIATGRAEVGRLRLIGDAIDRAAVLLGARGDDAAGIAIDDVTAALLDPRFETAREDGELRLLGARLAEAPARTVLGRVTPMLGREWEMRSIETFFRECAEEPAARPVLVTGAAGMGKSRLAHEVVAALRRATPNVEVWSGRGDPLRNESALGVLGQIIRSAAGVVDGDAPEARRRRLTHLVKSRAPARDVEWMVAILGEASGAPSPGDASPALHAARQDGRIMSEQIGAAWQALVDATCATRPLILVLNDLQWADGATIALVGAALAGLSHRPWLVLALARPEIHENHPGLWVEQGVQEIRLRSLSKRASVELAREVLGESAGPDTVERIAVRADGNAFYLEELLRAVAESKRTGSPVGPLPETVLGMVQARLSGLDAETRRLLRAASVFGDVFWLGGVAALLGGSPPRAGLDMLVQRELVSLAAGSRFAGETELSFRHGMLREGAYAMLTPMDRANGHALAGEWLLQHGEADAMVIAHHFELAGEQERAAGLLLRAATLALAAGDIQAAITCGSKALPHLGAGAERLACLRLLGEASVWQQSWAAADAHAGELAALAPAGRDMWFWAQGLQMTAAYALGRQEVIFQTMAAAMGTEPAPGAAAPAVIVLATCVLVLCFSGQLHMATAQAARVAALLERDATTDPVARGWAALSQTWVSAWIDGDPWTARRHARTACSIFEEARISRLERFARVFLAMTSWNLGLLDEAEVELRPLVRAAGDPLLGMIATRYLTFVLIERGELAEARRLAEERLAEARASGRGDSAAREAEGRWMLGVIAAREGDPSSAAEHLSASLDGLRTLPPQWLIAASRLAYVRLAQGRAAEALALTREAMEVQARMGGHGHRSLLLRVAHAEALHATGERDAAAGELREALALLHVRAEGIDDPAVRRRFLEGRAENRRALDLAREWGLLP